MSFTCRPDRRLIRTAFRSNRFVLVEIVAPAAARRSTRDPINVGFVVDRSGSMGGEKIRFARQAVEQGIASLHDEDRFSIVAYDDATEIVVPSTQADAGARRDAVRRLASVDARGASRSPRTRHRATWTVSCSSPTGSRTSA
jgi:Mg-chelatase subunit ChlD